MDLVGWLVGLVGCLAGWLFGYAVSSGEVCFAFWLEVADNSARTLAIGDSNSLAA